MTCHITNAISEAFSLTPKAQKTYVNRADYSLSNRHPDFSIHDDKGQCIKGVARGFLATRWLKKTDLDYGYIMADTDYYSLYCSDRLLDALKDCYPGSYMKAIRAICSFQILEDGSKRAVCQIFYKHPFVKEA